MAFKVSEVVFESLAVDALAKSAARWVEEEYTGKRRSSTVAPQDRWTDGTGFLSGFLAREWRCESEVSASSPFHVLSLTPKGAVSLWLQNRTASTVPSTSYMSYIGSGSVPIN